MAARLYLQNQRSRPRSAGARIPSATRTTWLSASAASSPALAPGAGFATSTAAVYGADVSGLLRRSSTSPVITIDANGAVEDATGTASDFHGNVNTNKSNQAWDAQLGWQSGAFMIKGGYQQVYTQLQRSRLLGQDRFVDQPDQHQGRNRLRIVCIQQPAQAGWRRQLLPRYPEQRRS